MYTVKVVASHFESLGTLSPLKSMASHTSCKPTLYNPSLYTAEALKPSGMDIVDANVFQHISYHKI